ncbi:Phthiocerol synthesis polyketide synthase type I PpsC [Sinobacterium norvegicum]|uniref:Phthiocerol synthesis polyketide synthase type I PpsC n=1 Tax=Sinobacterium norvegicum TaxID=1641715 RepID=A0ABN8EGD8_9GAMM|nr:NAD(P)H-quinone oxidoreductase [Sinobacterium norvegicum]CAH0990099.1 Phthiocerol synthesis polyketide synthase type I PpsC [Sinobacterium norvegicum]
MKAIVCEGAGQANIMRWRDVNKLAEPGENQVIIAVAAAGVNRPDVFQRMGLYPPPLGESEVLGLEISGQVVAVGRGVEWPALGDQVCALVGGGGYAQYCLATADHCMPIPSGIGVEHAAALPETVLTVWHNVFQRGNLQPGQTLLVHGGCSGIGLAAIQLALAKGAKVITTVGGDTKRQFCQQLGAEAIDYQRTDFVERVGELTQGRGVDVVLDMVGGDYIERNIQAAAFDSTIVSIAFLRGASVTVNMMPIMLKRINLTGSTLRARDGLFKAALCREVVAQCWPIIARGDFKIVVDSEFAMAEAVQAHERMESNGHIGKIVLLT